jgi:hypothetical protein
MENIDVSAAAVVAHLLITTIPWLIGMAAGGGLGLLCGFVIRAAFSAVPALRLIFVLLPWRTMVLALLMVVLSPFPITLLGIGPLAGGIMVAASIALLAMAFAATTLVEYWVPSPLSVRLIAGARTLAVASGLIAVGVGLFGGGGLGSLILEAVRLQEYGNVLKGLVLIGTLALALDLALALVQMIALQHFGDRGEPATTRA